MPVKTTGAEFKRFFDDDLVWKLDGYHTWVEDEEVTVNGRWNNDAIEALDQLDDVDVVTLSGGIVFRTPTGKLDVSHEEDHNVWDNDNAPSMETVFRRWKKKQNTAIFAVECKLDIVDSLKAAVKSAGGKVL